MCQVSVELLFPISRGIDRRRRGCVTLYEKVALGDRIGALLAALSQRHPGLRGSLVDADDGDLPPFLCVILNGCLLDHNSVLETKLGDGDVVTILPMYVGG